MLFIRLTLGVASSVDNAEEIRKSAPQHPRTNEFQESAFFGLASNARDMEHRLGFHRQCSDAAGFTSDSR
jgi:hypothetical protein